MQDKTGTCQNKRNNFWSDKFQPNKKNNHMSNMFLSNKTFNIEPTQEAMFHFISMFLCCIYFKMMFSFIGRNNFRDVRSNTRIERFQSLGVLKTNKPSLGGGESAGNEQLIALIIYFSQLHYNSQFNRDQEWLHLVHLLGWSWTVKKPFSSCLCLLLLPCLYILDSFQASPGPIMTERMR